MELLPEEIRTQLPALYSQEHEDDPLVMVKFFHPLSDWTWYAFEYSPEERLFFGWVVGFEKEIGYFSLDELEAIEAQLGIPMERDVSFKPMKLSEVKKLHSEMPPTQPPTIIVYFIVEDGGNEGE